MIRQKCAEHGIPVSVCGEVASRPVEALCLIALGYHTLSMPAAGIGPVKRMLRSLDLSAFVPKLRAAVYASNGSLRNEVLSIAAIQQIALKDT